MTRKSIPLALPTSYSVQMFGCVRAEIVRASRSKRSRDSVSAERCAGRTLMATERSSRVSRARHTSPMPPAPTRATTSYGPSRSPAATDMVRCPDYMAAFLLPTASLPVDLYRAHLNHRLYVGELRDVRHDLARVRRGGGLARF